MECVKDIFLNSFPHPKKAITYQLFLNSFPHPKKAITYQLTYSIDGWATRHEKFATFDPLKSDDNKEVWKVELVFPIAHEHPITDRIEFVLWCEDYRCIDAVHKIYKSSPLHSGEPFVALFQTKD